MGALAYALIIYIFGGLTFIPLLLGAVLLHAYLTFPVRNAATEAPPRDDLSRPGDRADSVKSASKGLEEKFHSRGTKDFDVAAGYFAVCREYVPGGINGKPPERTTPSGSTVVTSPSPSVYQSMYRSLFDRKKDSASPFDNHKGAPRPPNRSGNIFFVVLRHQHLLLFDTEEQLEVRYVLSLAHHDVSICNGDGEVPEGELFIKRNALCLTRKADVGEVAADGITSKPFYLFTDSLSDKEDFYFALLKNMERRSEDAPNVPKPLQFDVKHIIDLVQRLHSSEEQMQTRWFNAMVGRIFLGIYKTADVENFVRAKITKKISRVKKPAFLSKIVLQHVDMGGGAPCITNPRLKDFTVDGDCTIESDVLYTGNCRLEIAATARIELGTRFKAREVDLLLAVTCRRVEGHMLFRVKPPPSNRLWMTFETNPHIDLSIEPIVSSRQITYNVILRQIENRIKEVVAESIVMPFWDDLSFFNTEGKTWRGGVWADSAPSPPAGPKTATAAEGDVEGLERAPVDSPSKRQASAGKSKSTPPAGEHSPPASIFARKGTKSVFNLGAKANGSSTSVEARPATATSDTPRAIRKNSFASPVVSTDNTNIDGVKSSSTGEFNAASTMAAISARSPPSSATNTPVGSPSKDPSMLDSKPDSFFSNASKGDTREHSESDSKTEGEVGSADGASESNFHAEEPSPQVPSNPAAAASSFNSANSQLNYSLSNGSTKTLGSTASGASLNKGPLKRSTLDAVANAAENARKWGLSALQKSREQGRANESMGEQVDLSQPMGRGKPLPPPGTPLPPPDRRTKTAPIPVPKRKPVVPPPGLNPEQHEARPRTSLSPGASRVPPPLPRRGRSQQGSSMTDDGMLVVAAPESEPEPESPSMDKPQRAYMPPSVDEVEDEDFKRRKRTPPRLPERRTGAKSPEEGPSLPDWLAAKEEQQKEEQHARARDDGVDGESAGRSGDAEHISL